ncbi:MAG: carboxypeptidase regulatory-like domain-containing protein [Halobacteriales archaeon]|nr:carboxypeptidase regulatory-like domain-containing protein [Halobacteriales archaeon]
MAQDTRGGIAGRIVSEAGQPLAGTEIEASSPVLIGSRSVASGADGRFRMTQLPLGTYELRIQRIGHRSVTVEEVRVRLGEVTFPLGGVIELTETAVEVEPLVVQADQPTIDLSTAALENSLQDDVFLDIPTERDYRDLALLTPQTVVTGRGDPVNVAGATGFENLSYVDGFNTTDPFFGSVGTKLPYNFVREFQVKTDGYEAEYGGAAGGIFNAVTRSGDDEWSGSLFGYFSGSGITADARQGLRDLPARGADRYDIGIALGGPIVRDRLWFFGAYDPTFSRNEIEIPGHGFFDDELTEHLFAGKLDWRAGDRTDVLFTAFGDPTTHDRVGGGPFSQLTARVLDPEVFLNRVERGGLNLSSNVTHRASGNLVLDLNVGAQWVSGFDGPRPGDDEPRYECDADGCGPDIPQGTLSGGFGEEFSYDGRRYSGRLTATLELGDHSTKFGLEYQDFRLSPFTAFNSGVGVILDQGIAAPSDQRWLVIVQEKVADLASRSPTVFVQDSWAMSPQFRLNYGLRWDGQYLIDTEGAVAQAFDDQWQPRLGFVWTPGEPGVQKVTGSIGRFYQQMPLRATTGFYADRATSINYLIFYDSDPRIDGEPIDSTRFVFCCDIVSERDLKATHYDAVTLGYERAMSDNFRLGVRGIHRTLREVVNVGTSADGSSFVGNPGRGDLSNLDSPQRDYWALEITADYLNDPRLQASASYVLSRNYGNFPGLYNSDLGFAFPNENGIFQLESSMPMNEGLLPNDRPHRLKLWGAYRFDFGLTAGTFFSVQSGGPKSRYQAYFGTQGRFLSPRGSEGRYPALWDWNMRFQYPIRSGGGATSNLILDLLHIGNPQGLLWENEQESIDFDGPDGDAPRIPIASFGEPVAFQEPFTVRLGLEVSF